MAERSHRAQPVSVANHAKACQSLIECAVTWLVTESGWARRKRYAICSGKLRGGFIIFQQCCPGDTHQSSQQTMATTKERRKNCRSVTWSRHSNHRHTDREKCRGNTCRRRRWWREISGWKRRASVSFSSSASRVARRSPRICWRSSQTRTSELNNTLFNNNGNNRNDSNNNKINVNCH